jgi:hypothetical protein
MKKPSHPERAGRLDIAVSFWPRLRSMLSDYFVARSY